MYLQAPVPRHPGAQNRCPTIPTQSASPPCRESSNLNDPSLPTLQCRWRQLCQNWSLPEGRKWNARSKCPTQSAKNNDKIWTSLWHCRKYPESRHLPPPPPQPPPPPTTTPTTTTITTTIMLINKNNKNNKNWFVHIYPDVSSAAPLLLLVVLLFSLFFFLFLLVITSYY